MNEPQQERALRLATDAGHLLLENGAEIGRVEETMDRISSAYGVGDRSFFVLSNGIIATGHEYAKAEFIPIKGTQLSRVVEVNQLSRDVALANPPISLDELERRLIKIRSSAGKPWWELVLGIAFGVGSFCVLFGGSLIDALATFVCGIILGFFIAFVSPHMSRMMGNLIGGMIGGMLCIATYAINPTLFHLPNMIIGTIIALVPGVPFTNGIRDMANEDYIAGATRLLDAFIAFLCIAIGVVLAFIVHGLIAGGLIQLGSPTTDLFASNIWIQLAAALLGTIGFSALFGAPRRYYFDCGLAGMIGWGIYLWVSQVFSVVAGALAGALAVAVVSHLLAKIRRCPVTVFLICGIIPLVPGGGIFWTAYYLVSDQLSKAATTGFTAVKITIAIAGGIIIATGMFNQMKKIFSPHRDNQQ